MLLLAAVLPITPSLFYSIDPLVSDARREQPGRCRKEIGSWSKAKELANPNIKAYRRQTFLTDGKAFSHEKAQSYRYVGRL
jgi:hypothetical protein